MTTPESSPSPTPRKPKRFTQVPVLDAITVKHIHRFFTHFDPLLVGRRLPLPVCMAGTQGYDEAWAHLLSKPELLPASLVEAVLAIEELAAPENRARLEEMMRQGRAAGHACLDGKETPECHALQLWLISPYRWVDGELVFDASFYQPSTPQPSTSTSPRPSDGNRD